MKVRYFPASTYLQTPKTIFDFVFLKAGWHTDQNLSYHQYEFLEVFLFSFLTNDFDIETSNSDFEVVIK